MANLALSRLGARFATPIVLASGPAGFGYELAHDLNLEQVGAITTKTITREPRTGNPQPRLVDCACGALNSIGLENPGIDAFIDSLHARIIELPLRKILSLAATSDDEMEQLVTQASALSGVDAIELNLSCPNVGGTVTGADAEAVSRFVRAAVNASPLPVLAKLPGDAGNLLRSAEKALEAGAAGLTLINSVRGLRVDWNTGKPFLHRQAGGLSGPAILPIALARVFEVRQAFPQTLIIGTGGVSDLGGCLEMMMAGADLVGIGFGLMVDPGLPQTLGDDLRSWLDERGVASIEDIIGAAQPGGFDVR